VKPHRTYALVASSLFPALVACGASVQTADRGAGQAQEAYLVQTSDGSPGAGEALVTLSSWDVNPADALPAAAPPEVVEEMRAEAAARGATRLWIERVDTPWRRAYFGLGTRPDAESSAEPVPCAHASFADGIIAASGDADRCLAAIRRERPALRGEITVIFQVDAWGDVMRAAPTPDSTRDGQAQRCALDAVYDASFGPPLALTCGGTLTVTFPPSGAE